MKMVTFKKPFLTPLLLLLVGLVRNSAACLQTEGCKNAGGKCIGKCKEQPGKWKCKEDLCASKGCACRLPDVMEKKRKDDSDPRRFNEAERTNQLNAALKRYKEKDPSASFTFYNGRIDSFATSSNTTIPEYAKDVLRQLGLPIVPQKPRMISAPTTVEKKGNDFDADLSTKLPYVDEDETKEKSYFRTEEDNIDDNTGEQPQVENRQNNPKDRHQMLDWDRPSKKELIIERKAAHEILKNFLATTKDLFEVDEKQFVEAMKMKSYQRGAYVRRAEYTQFLGGSKEGEEILYGKTLVHFDVNWNLVGISRMIVTPEKLSLKHQKDDIGEEKAIKLASTALKGCVADKWSGIKAGLKVDLVRRQKLWNVEISTRDGNCHWSTLIDRENGTIINVSNHIAHFNDAMVNRHYYSGGNLFNPAQTVSTNQYTRNDRRLEHDFFYVMNDHRCEGDPETSCSAVAGTGQCSEAYGSSNGGSYVRATRRTARDFDKYYPSGASETFGETHTYYWSRQFCQWLKPSLDSMGVLPSSASDYTRVLMITNHCRSRGSVYNSRFDVTTDDNKGEKDSTIRIAHRALPTDHNAACEGDSCFDNPSNIAHELIHFFLDKYYGVGTDVDCGGANQLLFTHEGILGTAGPQAFWDSYYGVGYDPVTTKGSTNYLYFSHDDIGRVHSDNTNLLKISDYLCVDNTDDPYRTGRVLGQALWKFYHGVKVSGATTSGTWRPSTDTDFNTLVYWAADLQSASTYKDRYEYANRLMEILEFHSNWSSSGKQDYCDIFATHECDNFITSSYCS